MHGRSRNATSMIRFVSQLEKLLQPRVPKVMSKDVMAVEESTR